MKYSKLKYIIFFIITIFSFNSYADKLIIDTHDGKIQGSEKNNVISWTGIPYAEAPVNNLRWKSPQPNKKWTTILDATKPAKECIQVTPNGFKGEEDCLNLNIYAPDIQSKNLPVLVYIHGGNNQIGSSAEFAPQELAKKINAIVIIMNYRLGALGFNPLKALNTANPLENSGNYTLLDINHSLDWIIQNIQFFGGDPKNITISGFSAGGRDIMAMLISPIFKDKFQKAIVFSGGMTTADKDESEKIFVERIAKVVVEKGIKNNITEASQWLLNGGDEVKSFLYNLPASDLATLFGDAGIRMKNFPHLYRDGYIIPKDGFNTKNFNAVPLLMITGQSEFSLFALSDPFFSSSFAKNPFTTDSLLLNQYKFSNKYGGEFYSLFNVESSAVKMHPNYKAPIYGLEFKFGMDSYVTGKSLNAVGSFHGIFMPFWDTSKYQQYTSDTLKIAAFKDIEHKFNSYLSNFIHTGNPNGSGLVEWKTWSPENKQAGSSLLIIDANKEKSLIYMSSKNYNNQDVINAIKLDNSISEKDKLYIIKNVLNERWFSEELDKNF